MLIFANRKLQETVLSILIPTYEFDCSALVRGLVEQGRALREAESDFSFEVLVADDGSSSAPRAALAAALPAADVRLLLPPHNVGRAAIRNLLVSEARGDSLLFVDDDAALCTDDFLATYWQYRDAADVLCGSLRSPKKGSLDESGRELRLRYERRAFSRLTPAVRNRRPYDAFTAFNALFARRVFDKVGFDERCRRYGHEDTLLGLELERNGFSVKHIENPLIHTGIDTNAEFLQKTETALQTLAEVGEPLQSRVATSRTYRRLRLLAPLFRLTHKLLRAPLRRNLLGTHPTLTNFQLYKFLFFSELMKK